MNGGHAGDQLSGLLDGELDPSEAAAVREHVAGCADCARELESVATARGWARRLPPVPPPVGFLEALLLPARGRWRRGVVALAGTAAASLAVVGLAHPRPSSVAPPVPDLVERHAATASVASDPVSELVPAGVPVVFGP